MLSKALVFAFCFLGIFGLLMATMDSHFIVLLPSSVSYITKEAAHRFSIANITTYKTSSLDYMDYPYSSLDNCHSASPPQWSAGLPSSQYFEVWFAPYAYSQPHLQFRHTTISWYRDTHILKIYKADGITYVGNTLASSFYIDKTRLLNNFQSSANASVFHTTCEHVQANVLVGTRYSYYTLAQSWDAGKLNYTITYEMDYNSTGLNAWNLVGNLLSFQNPDLGIGGTGGIIVNAMIALPIWSMIAYIIYKLIAGIIPFISGGSGD